MPDTEILDDLELPGQQGDAEAQEPSGELSGQTPDGEKPAEGEAATKVTSLFQPDGRKLDPAVKVGLAKLKAESPEVAKLVSRAIYRTAELEREFPGGLTEARELRDKVDGLGGLLEIEGSIQTAREFTELAVAFEQGSPAFVDDMLATSPQAFATLAPIIFGKYAEIHPEGWQSYIGRIVYGDLQKNEIPVAMTRLADSLRRDDKEGAAEAFNQVAGYLASYKDLASRQVAAPKLDAPKPKDDDLNKREETLRSREWKTERAGIYRRLADEQYRFAIGSRKPTSEELAQIQELFQSRAGRLTRQNFPDWERKSEAFIRANDKAGYLRYMASIYRKVVPEAAASAVRSTLKSAPARTTATTTRPAAQTQQRQQQAVATDQSGTFKPIGKEPGTWDIDYDRTSPAMLAKNRAVLIDGRKVEWR